METNLQIQKMKYLIICSLMFFVITSEAQNNRHSPFTYYSPAVDSLFEELYSKLYHKNFENECAAYDYDMVINSKRPFNKIKKGKVACVHHLRLYSKKNIYFTENINRLNNLQYINANADSIIYDTLIKELPSLKMYYISLFDGDCYKFHHAIPTFLYDCQNLVSINIYLNSFNVIDFDRIKKLNHLEQLIFHLPKAEPLPNFIFELSKLHVIDISFKDYDEILLDERITGLTKMRKLSIPINITDNIDILKRLPDLRCLEVARCSDINDVNIRNFPKLERIGFTELSNNDREILKKNMPSLEILLLWKPMLPKRNCPK